MSALSNTAEEQRGGALAASTAIVHLHYGKPVTNSLAISREFGRRHDNVLQSLDGLIEDGTISRLEFKETAYKDAQGKKQRMIELTERGALIAMPFIGGKNSRIGQVRLVDAFLAMRDELVSHCGNWLASRKQLATTTAAMYQALQAVRAEDGKETATHHYANESRMINGLLFDAYDALDREHLAQSDLTLLEKVEIRNTFLIARGRNYQERKAALCGFSLSLRAQPSERLQ